jgi:hypothetical protein
VPIDVTLGPGLATISDIFQPLDACRLMTRARLF